MMDFCMINVSNLYRCESELVQGDFSRYVGMWVNVFSTSIFNVTFKVKSK